MDHGEEQGMELEALEAIYGEDYKKLEDAPPKFEIILVPEIGGEDNHVSVALEVTFTPTYPEEEPDISIRPVKGLTQSKVNPLTQQLKDKVLELLGMAMIMELCQTVQEWLLENNEPEDMDMHAQMMKRLEKEKSDAAAPTNPGPPEDPSDPKPKARDVAVPDNPALDPNKPYTLVTPESFAEWRRKFEQEEKETASKTKEKKGLTGRQMFEGRGENLAALIASDGGALADDEEAVDMTTREKKDEDEEEGEQGQNETTVDEAATSVLEGVGDEDLFLEDEDLDDLPED